MVVQGMQCGNAMIYVNDYRKISRFPNADYLHVIVNGWPVILVVTCADIKAGQQILADYGQGFWDHHASSHEQTLHSAMETEEQDEGERFGVKDTKAVAAEDMYETSKVQGQQRGAPVLVESGRRSQGVARRIVQWGKGKELMVEQVPVVHKTGTGPEELVEQERRRKGRNSLAWHGAERIKSVRWSRSQRTARSTCAGNANGSSAPSSPSAAGERAVPASAPRCAPHSHHLSPEPQKGEAADQTSATTVLRTEMRSARAVFRAANDTAQHNRNAAASSAAGRNSQKSSRY